MRERLECAVVSAEDLMAWAAASIGSHAGGRLHIHLLDTTGSPVDQVLGDAASALRRYDVCLVPIHAGNLPWARKALSAARGRLQTPVIGLVCDLKAAALDDLYAIGLADFVRSPLCLDELRVRIEKALDRHRYPHNLPADAHVGEPGARYPLNAHAAAGPPEDVSGPLEAFAIASATRSTGTRVSFRDAKSEVIQRFERAYLRAALGRHSGNIAMAARASQKHRRAFWALMRKHEINAEAFRRECPSARPNDVAWRPGAPDTLD